MNLPTIVQPYELHSHGGGFTVFMVAGEAVGLPLIQLGKATLRGEGGQRMVFEFSAALAVVEGEGLAELFGHTLAGRVKTIRPGTHGDCTVRIIQLVES